MRACWVRQVGRRGVDIPIQRRPEIQCNAVSASGANQKRTISMRLSISLKPSIVGTGRERHIKQLTERLIGLSRYRTHFSVGR
jgi:hypothetical protein